MVSPLLPAPLVVLLAILGDSGADAPTAEGQSLERLRPETGGVPEKPQLEQVTGSGTGLLHCGQTPVSPSISPKLVWPPLGLITRVAG